MSTVQDVLDTQQRIEGNLLTKMAELERKLQASPLESKPHIDKLTQEFNDFKKLVSSMFTLLHHQISLLVSQTDIIDNQQRLNALLFSGIQESDSEDCKNTIMDIITKKLGLRDCQSSSIYVCHRLGVKTADRHRPIIARFNDINMRNRIWKEKKLLKATSIVISEFLTKNRQILFSSARKHFGMTRCWTQDGNIFVKLTDIGRRRILSASDLDELVAKYPSPHTGKEPSSPSSITKMAVPQQPRPLAAVVAKEPPATRKNTAKGKSNRS